MSAVAAIFSFLSNGFAWLTGKSSQKNQPDVKAAAKAQDETNESDKDSLAIAEHNDDRVREEISEN